MVFINFVCDETNCKTLQSADFEELYETWGQMLDAMMEAGWQIKMNRAKIEKCICPKHNK
jgi:hypothetical protein